MTVHIVKDIIGTDTLNLYTQGRRLYWYLKANMGITDHIDFQEINSITTSFLTVSLSAYIHDTKHVPIVLCEPYSINSHKLEHAIWVGRNSSTYNDILTEAYKDLNPPQTKNMRTRKGINDLIKGIMLNGSIDVNSLDSISNRIIEALEEEDNLVIPDKGYSRRLLLDFRNWWYANRKNITGISNEEIDEFLTR